jgi:hypothetical protein
MPPVKKGEPYVSKKDFWPGQDLLRDDFME